MMIINDIEEINNQTQQNTSTYIEIIDYLKINKLK
jgi:hypothetical protein